MVVLVVRALPRLPCSLTRCANVQPVRVSVVIAHMYVTGVGNDAQEVSRRSSAAHVHDACSGEGTTTANDGRARRSVFVPIVRCAHGCCFLALSVYEVLFCWPSGRCRVRTRCARARVVLGLRLTHCTAAGKDVRPMSLIAAMVSGRICCSRWGGGCKTLRALDCSACCSSTT